MKYTLIIPLRLALNIKAQDTAREYHPNGYLALEYPKFGNESDGLCRIWYDNGQLSS